MTVPQDAERLQTWHVFKNLMREIFHNIVSTQGTIMVGTEEENFEIRMLQIALK